MSDDILNDGVDLVNLKPRPAIPELPFLNEKDHPETLSIASPYIRSYHNAITAQGINVAGSIGMFNGAFRELFFVMSRFEERINDLEQAYFEQKQIIENLKSENN